MLLPLAAGLFVRARYPDTAEAVQPAAAQASNTALVFLVVLALVLNFEAMLATIGTGVILAVLGLVAAAFVVGFFLGGPGLDTRSVLGLGTAQRNVSAALVVGTANFDDPDVIVVLVVGSTLMIVVLLLAGGELGRRAEHPEGRPAAGGTGTDGGTTAEDRSG
jgi:BASS family bile acid:Na+ symporter